MANTPGSISVTGVNVQWAPLAKCRSRAASELQRCSAVLLLENRTLKLPGLSVWNCFHRIES